MRWLPVVGYEEFYEVSDTGLVRSFDRVTRGRGGKARITRGKNLKGLNVEGYLTVRLSAFGIAKTARVHSLVAAAFLGPRQGQIVRHLDGDGMNPRLSNLKYGTFSENLFDAFRHGSRSRHQCREAALQRWTA